jgi:hypothetical protein
VDFTREPIIETIITPKEGHKLVIRSSKSAGQEEYFVDAVEIIAFGHALFFRSLERPKAFLVPVSDYEVLEVREARMVLKNVGMDRSIKIGGGREGASKVSREVEKVEVAEEEVEQEMQPVGEGATETRPEVRTDKKRERRRHYRKRRGREEKEEGAKGEAAEVTVPPLEDEKINIQPPEEGAENTLEGAAPMTPALLSSLLQPPPTLISETIGRYRQNELFKGAFYLTEDDQYKPHDKVQELLNEDEEEEVPSLQEPAFEPTEPSEEGNTPLLAEERGEEERSEEAGQEDKEELEHSEEKAEDNSSFASNEEEYHPTLPIYADEEDTSMATESPYSTELEEEKPAKNNQQPSHEEE